MKILYRLSALVYVLLSGLAGYSQVNLSVINSAYTQDFSSLASSGTTNDVSTLPTGWLFVETGTNANTTYAAGTGSSNAGNTYSFGLDADRALGGLLSGSLNPLIGAQFVNNTGSTLTSLEVNYVGEQWRLGASGRGADRLDFQYSFDATSLNSGTWTNADSLDFSSPVTIGTVGALNGNINATPLSFTISGIAVVPGATFWIRWQDFNVSSSDDGLAIDNFSLIPMGIPSDQPSITLAPDNLSFGSVNLRETDTISYKVIGQNLTDSITVTLSDPVFEISLDGINYSSSLLLPADGGKVTVRFTPIVNGAVSDTVLHESDSVSSTLTVNGSGYDPVANIIPIASARIQSLGTKVTVAGRITSANQLGSPSYIQDSSGGIPVFDFTLSNAVEIGDSVIVTGPIGVFSNQVQISGSGIFFSIVDVPSFTPAPKFILVDELSANEGLLVTVQQVELVNKQFVFYPQSTERMIASGVETDLRIDGDTDIPGLTKPQGVVDITGVVGRFQTNAQLLPRFQADVPDAVEPSTPSDSIPKSQTFDVVNWNLEFFGAAFEDYNDEFGPADEALQLENVRRVIDSLSADVIAVQEVADDSLFQVLTSLLPRYQSICSDRYSFSFNGPDTTFPPQKVCFLYDTMTVSVTGARPLFEMLYDSARTVDPSLLPSYPTGTPSSFWSSGRLPYSFTAFVTIEGVTEKVNFVNIHAKSGSASADRLRRIYDGQVLKDSLDAYFQEENFIILGDYNDDLDQSIVAGQSSSYQNFVDDSTHYVPITKTLSETGARSTVSFSDMIDHQVLSDELAASYIDGSVQVITPFRMVSNYANTTSDHLPVTSRFRFEAPVASFAVAADTVAEDSTAYNVVIQFTKPLSVDKVITVSVSGDPGAVYVGDYSTSPDVSTNLIQLQTPAGTEAFSFLVTIVADSVDEVNESVYFEILSQSGIELGNNSQFILTIEDDDVPAISFAAPSANIEEGAAPYEVVLNLSQAPATDQSITIALTSTGSAGYGSDYTTTPDGSTGQLVVSVPAGSTETSFTFTALSDFVKEKNPEGVTFTLAATTPGLTAGTQTDFSANIIDVRKKKVKFFVVPNPTHGFVWLVDTDVHDDYEGTINVTLRKANGQVIYSGSGTPREMSAELSSRLRDEHRGIYLLNVLADGEVSVIRILKI